MASKDEIRIMQKRLLTQLKMVKKMPNTLDQLITMTEAEMEQEDVAHVEKKLAELNQQP